LLVAALGLVASVRQAHAVAEVHRLNLVLSTIPTSITPSEFNDRISLYNDQVLGPRGIEGLESLGFGWLFDAELRYFVRQNIAISAGVGQLRSSSSREVLPGIQQDIQLRAEILAIPIHVGAAYYLQPYNQGDFQARAYLGGGLLSNVYDFARFHAAESGTDTLTTLGGTYKVSARGDSPGYYVETGVHMFFATRFSVMISALWRSSVIREAPTKLEFEGVEIPTGTLDIDVSGVGARMALAIGF